MCPHVLASVMKMKRMKRVQLLDDLLNVLVLVKVVVADVEILEWRRCMSVSRSASRTNDHRTDNRSRQVKVDHVWNLWQSPDRKLGPHVNERLSIEQSWNNRDNESGIVFDDPRI